ncbi:hypothetical protein ACM799_30705, partial [Pseudomonas aeruginosa]
QAEAERPEVASLTADLYEIAERILEIAEGRPKAISTTLMAPVRDYRLKDAKAVARVMGERLVALADRYVHHDRVVGALRFERQQMDRAFTACINERDAANARLHEVATACATAEQERDAALAEVERLRQFERICEGLPQDSIDGGWTVQGIRGYAKRLEDQLKAAQAQHSVPEGFREKFKQCMELAFAEIAYYVSPEKARDPNSRARKAGALATELHAMLAAAPGKEGV